MISQEDIVQIIYSTVKLDSLDSSVEAAAQKIMDLAQQSDIIAIMTSYSARIYGKRGGRCRK